MKIDSSLRLVNAVCNMAFLLIVFSAAGVAQGPLKLSDQGMFAIRDGVVLQSPDGGTTWDEMKDAPHDARLILPDLRDKERVLVACLGGIYQFSGHANTWISVLSLPPAFEPTRLERSTSNPDVIIMSGIDDTGNFPERELAFFSHDNGLSWVRGK